MGMMSRRNKKYRESLKNVVKKETEVKTEVKTEVNKVVAEEPKEEEKAFYTKTDIMTMNVANLRTLAKEQGIENADNTSGAKLKEMLVEKMGL